MPATILLATKLQVPPASQRLVPRPHLIQRLNDSLHGKLVLLSTPAGFGKTTLLSEWVRQSKLTAAWISLDEDDNDPSRFVEYTIAALKTIQPGFGESILQNLEASQADARDEALQAALAALINELARLERPFVLILDDFHVLREPAVLKVVTYLIEHMPQQMTLLLATRADPPLRLAGLRGRRQLAEIRGPDLRFSSGEAATFLNNVMQLGLTQENVNALTGRTEGWICGLVLAALALREHQDAAGFVQSFAVSERYVLDYLFEEVFIRQPPEVQSFLLHTCILARLNSELCEALLAGTPWQTSTQANLEYLEGANLLTPLGDDEQRWYRYHRLFADLLRHQLYHQHPELAPGLHSRAATWYEERGYLDEAIEHWLQSNDVAQVARLVEYHAARLLDEGQLARLARWLAQIPEACFEQRPWLCVYHAWALVLSGQAGGADQLLEARLDQVSRAVGTNFLHDQAGARALHGQVEAIRAYGFALHGDFPNMIQSARHALELLPEEAYSIRGVIAFMLGGVWLLQNNTANAEKTLEQAVQMTLRAGNIHAALPAMNAIAGLYKIQGKLNQAETVYAQAADLVERDGKTTSPAAAGIYSGQGLLRYERNDLERANQSIDKGVELCPQWGNIDTLLNCYAAKAYVRLATGSLEVALELIHAAEQAASKRMLTPGSDNLFSACKMRILLAKGEIAAASRLARERHLSRETASGIFVDIELLGYARLLSIQGQTKEAIEVVERICQATYTARRAGTCLSACCLLAVLHWQEENQESAFARLEQALELAQPEGYLRTFMDEGEPMHALLVAFRRDTSRLETESPMVRAERIDYIDQIISGFQPHALPSTQPAESGRSLTPSRIAGESLTARELELMCLVAAGLSNQDIARQLVISVGTVKAHTASIYRKLDVKSRTQAIARSRELSLL